MDKEKQRFIRGKRRTNRTVYDNIDNTRLGWTNLTRKKLINDLAASGAIEDEFERQFLRRQKLNILRHPIIIKTSSTKDRLIPAPAEMGRS